MTAKDRFLDLAPWGIAALLIAGVVHIVSILLMPAVATRDAYARLATAARIAETTSGGVALLAAPAPGAETLPFEDPAMARGVCVFDLAKGLLRVRGAADAEDLLGLSFHAGGRIFHSMTDRSAIKGKIDIVVGDAGQIEAVESDDAGAAPAQEVRIAAPSRRGFVLIRSFAKRPSDQERARQRLRSMSCEVFQPPEQ
jgi:uncharacterized membrane protein